MKQSIYIQKKEKNMLNKSAPKFKLTASDGSVVDSTQLQGFILLLFYPMNNTPTCDRQLGELSANIAEFQKRNTQVFGINPAKLEKHQTYCDKKGLAFPILSDPSGKVAKAFKAHMKWLPVNNRTVVIIDPHKQICFYERGVPSIASMLDAIDNLKAKKLN